MKTNALALIVVEILFIALKTALQLHLIFLGNKKIATDSRTRAPKERIGEANSSRLPRSSQ